MVSRAGRFRYMLILTDNFHSLILILMFCQHTRRLRAVCVSGVHIGIIPVQRGRERHQLEVIRLGIYYEVWFPGDIPSTGVEVWFPDHIPSTGVQPPHPQPTPVARQWACDQFVVFLLHFWTNYLVHFQRKKNEKKENSVVLWQKLSSNHSLARTTQRRDSSFPTTIFACGTKFAYIKLSNSTAPSQRPIMSHKPGKCLIVW